MRTTQQMSITLPNEMAEFVRTNVASGDYASDSEVLRDALRALRERDRAVDAWLRNEVVPAAQALRDDPSRALSVDQVRAELSLRPKRWINCKDSKAHFGRGSPADRGTICRFDRRFLHEARDIPGARCGT
ncbi:CopG/Arc/MetJ family transcriptional regulator (modular protein) [Burkholderia sp. 8Y]|nr:CopG/Arc/MetJ family transcriptional regulator (modular protein) [Burkholderia sp. 8Y]